MAASLIVQVELSYDMLQLTVINETSSETLKSCELWKKMRVIESNFIY